MTQTLPTQNNMDNDTQIAIFQNVLLRIAGNLSDEQKDHLNGLFAQDGSEMEVVRFLKQTVPGIETIVKEETERFQKEVDDIVGEM